MSDSTATAVTGTQRIAAAVALVAAVVTVLLAVTVAIIRFPGGLAVLACVVVAIVAAWLGVVRRGTARVVGIAVAVLALLAAVALLFRNNGWPYLVCLVIGVVIWHAASRIAFRCTCGCRSPSHPAVLPIPTIAAEDAPHHGRRSRLTVPPGRHTGDRHEACRASIFLGRDITGVGAFA
jgi:hypothetical protein